MINTDVKQRKGHRAQCFIAVLDEFDDFVNPRGNLNFFHSSSLMRYSNLTKHTGSVSGFYPSFYAEDTD